jgi:hypothetical protein
MWAFQGGVLFALVGYRLQGLEDRQCHSLNLTVKHRATYLSVLVDVAVTDDSCVVAGKETKQQGIDLLQPLAELNEISLHVRSS